MRMEKIENKTPIQISGIKILDPACGSGAFVVEALKRYLKALGDVVNQTIRCASIEMYAHTGSFLDPHLRFGSEGPVGVDLLYNFRVEKHYFYETVEAIKEGKLRINMNNPQTVDIARVLMEKIRRRESLSYKRLKSHEQGLILEPYMTHMLQKAGKGRRTVLQNVELLDREGVLRCLVDGDTIEYKPTPAPVMLQTQVPNMAIPAILPARCG